MSKKNLIFLLGTKAQYIKTIPIINEIDSSKFEILIYDTCQHANITKHMIKNISNKHTHIKISKNKISSKKISEVLKWFFITIISLRKFKSTKKNDSICIVHGNTLSTVIGVLWGKLNKIRILHIEGGYRSFNWLKPFPEEIIRYWTSKFSDFIICFDDKSMKNLETMKIRGKIIRISRNTIFDTIPKNLDIKPDKSRLIISVHRNENVYVKKTLKDLVNFLVVLKENYFDEVKWYLHKHTNENLRKQNLISTLNENSIETSELVDHDIFLEELHNAKCIITDGESILEECKIIGLPTYALLNNLENEAVVRKNIFVSGYKHTENLHFFENLDTYKLTKEKDTQSPSKEIYEKIRKVI